jgi:hypothetical protein
VHEVVGPFIIDRYFFGVNRIAGQFQVDYPYFSGIPIRGRPCRTPANLPDTEAWLREFLLNQVLPCLEKYSDPQAILQAYLDHDEAQKNTTDALSWHGCSSAAMGLIYASLFGREHFAGLKQRYAQIFEPLLPEYKDQVRRLLAYLDQKRLQALPELATPA